MNILIFEVILFTWYALWAYYDYRTGDTDEFLHDIKYAVPWGILIILYILNILR